MRIRGPVNPGSGIWDGQIGSGIWDGQIGSEIRNTVYDNRIHEQNKWARQTSKE
jgi:hypothetical protein